MHNIKKMLNISHISINTVEKKYLMECQQVTDTFKRCQVLFKVAKEK